MGSELRTPPCRRRLPNRRSSVTHDVAIGNAVVVATVGLNESGAPAEVFLSGAKDGSGLAAILDDASVIISIALQHGISARALAKSISRLPETLSGPAIQRYRSRARFAVAIRQPRASLGMKPQSGASHIARTNNGTTSRPLPEPGAPAGVTMGHRGIRRAPLEFPRRLENASIFPKLI